MAIIYLIFILISASIIYVSCRAVDFRRFMFFSLLSSSLIITGCMNDSNDITPINKDENESEVNTETEKISSEKKGNEDVSGSEERHSKRASAEIHFIDVDQGDATLIKGPDFIVLVDAGRHDRNDVVPYLQKVGVTEIDLLVGTHPHADHIGQIDQVIEAFSVKEVWMSGNSHTTVTFERIINAVIDHEVDYYEPKSGDQFQIGSLEITVVNPLELTGDFNDDSISLVATYGDISVLLTGDVEKETEEAMVRRKEPVEAQIFQLGHHGSSTSNTELFLQAVNPEVVIYSAGLDNSYGHPHNEVIQMLNNKGIPVYGTVRNGSIIVQTDGVSYTIDADNLTEYKEKTTSVQKEETPASMTRNCININTASVEELQKITHIGLERAEQLIALRPLASVDELTKINGIGSGRLKDIKAEGKVCISN